MWELIIDEFYQMTIKHDMFKIIVNTSKLESKYIEPNKFEQWFPYDEPIEIVSNERHLRP